MIEIMQVKYINDYKLMLEFNNGDSGIIDLKDQL